MAKDSSGNGNDGQMTDCKWVKGKFGVGVEFNGKSSVIQVLHNDSIDFKDALTIEAWCKPASLTTNYATITRKGSGAGDPGNVGWGLDLGAQGNKLRGFIYPTPGNPVILECSTNLIPDKWQHAAMVFNGKKIIVYLDGKLDGEIECKGIAKNTGTLWVGKKGDESIFLHGVIDELALWASARTEEQLQQDAQGIKPSAVKPAGKLAISWGSLKASY